MSKYILSVDGGGIRGIIPATVLAEIEKRTRKPIAQIFDLIAGTSTGGIVVAGLCKKDDQLNILLKIFYQKYGSYIFRSFFLRKAIAWFNGAEYSYKNLEHVLTGYFGEDTLSNTLSNLLLTSYDIDNHCPFFFKNWREDRNLIKLKDALRATTAAPTYFTPKHLKINQINRVLIDGGIFANNPAACGYASGKRLFPNDDITILSLGTGTLERTIKYSSSKRLGNGLSLYWILCLA